MPSPTFPLLKVRGKTLRVLVRRMEKDMGRTWWVPKGGKGKVVVDESLGGLPLLTTLVHEAVHHLDWRLSESRTQHLEYGIVQMVLSNPELFAALAEQSPNRKRRRRRK